MKIIIFNLSYIIEKHVMSFTLFTLICSTSYRIFRAKKIKLECERYS